MVEIMMQIRDKLTSHLKGAQAGGRRWSARWLGVPMLLVATSCGEGVATIDPGQAQPGADLSGLEVPEGALVALPDGQVLDVRGPEASHDTRHSARGRGSVLALDGTEWKEVADPPPFNPTIYHATDMVRVLGEEKIAVVGTECVGARVPDGIEECDDAYVPVVSILDTSTGDWSKRVVFDVPNIEDEPTSYILATEGDDLLVNATGGSDALVWVNPYTGDSRLAEGFVPEQVDSICDLGDRGVMQVVNRTSVDQHSQGRVDVNDPEADQKGVSLEPRQSELEVVVSRSAKPAERIASIPTKNKVSPNDLGTPVACGGGNVAIFGSPDPTDPDAGGTVEVRDGTDFGLVDTIAVPPGSTLMADPPAVTDPVTGDMSLLSADLTQMDEPLENPSGCILRTLNDQTYCEEEGQLRRVTP